MGKTSKADDDDVCAKASGLAAKTAGPRMLRIICTEMKWSPSCLVYNLLTRATPVPPSSSSLHYIPLLGRNTCFTAEESAARPRERERAGAKRTRAGAGAWVLRGSITFQVMHKYLLLLLHVLLLLFLLYLGWRVLPLLTAACPAIIDVVGAICNSRRSRCKRSAARVS